MSKQRDKKERLDSAKEDKRLSVYPEIRRAILRAWFAVILTCIFGWVRIIDLMESSADVYMFIEALIGAVVSLFLLAFCVLLILTFRRRHWEKLARLFKVGYWLLMSLCVVSGLYAVVVALVFQAGVVLFIGLLAATILAIWSRDFGQAASAAARMNNSLNS